LKHLFVFSRRDDFVPFKEMLAILDHLLCGYSLVFCAPYLAVLIPYPTYTIETLHIIPPDFVIEFYREFLGGLCM